MNSTDRDLLRLALPALGALVAEPVYVLTDTAIVGRLGTVPLAGLAIASAVLLSGYAVFIFLACAAALPKIEPGASSMPM